MNIIIIVFTAFALAMDAFAVSVSKGMTLKNLTKGTAIKIALFFGGFQAAMPLIGWVLGISFQGYIKAIDHWIALILLTILGGKMIYEFYENRKESANEGNEIVSEISTTLDAEENNKSELSNKELTTLAIATSIDALAIGVSFAFLNVNILSSSLIIGIITFVVCFIGVIAGKKIGGIFKDYAELVGGIILIIIGINIFNEHTGFIMNLIHSIFK
ncbi:MULTISPECIES: manganese efflux pump MntP family protein [unclassified Clostridium]|uniref:manganese efflux pump MntP n=1 Tax=Clostridium TaxID=1485 RepID=UPI001C8CDF2A|nr:MULTISPECIES: manganese efflux pump MntP family protein [unclassified Clostridium]MBX9136953.1 manganese efflux pump [Clostridium sp. K12(2020)]MBX9143729.1 manganese efflux pump [Clostridium sp. K13]MDU2291069.1 manganese efflux pump MntP family protein [Clostridium celatum]MDU4325480.1 manganese efflux pump MntP family protein [Clostridium celatum]